MKIFYLIILFGVDLATGLYYQENQSKYLENFFLIFIFFPKHTLFYTLIVSKSENSSLIDNFKIIINEKESSNKFPNEFSIEFNEFNKSFSIKFVKITKSTHSHPIASSDIYVIDEKSGQPVLYKNNKKSDVS